MGSETASPFPRVGDHGQADVQVEPCSLTDSASSSGPKEAASGFSSAPSSAFSTYKKTHPVDHEGKSPKQRKREEGLSSPSPNSAKSACSGELEMINECAKKSRSSSDSDESSKNSTSTERATSIYLMHEYKESECPGQPGSFHPRPRPLFDDVRSLADGPLTAHGDKYLGGQSHSPKALASMAPDERQRINPSLGASQKGGLEQSNGSAFSSQSCYSSCSDVTFVDSKVKSALLTPPCMPLDATEEDVAKKSINAPKSLSPINGLSLLKESPRHSGGVSLLDLLSKKGDGDGDMLDRNDGGDVIDAHQGYTSNEGGSGGTSHLESQGTDASFTGRVRTRADQDERRGVENEESRPPHADLFVAARNEAVEDIECFQSSQYQGRKSLSAPVDKSIVSTPTSSDTQDKKASPDAEHSGFANARRATRSGSLSHEGEALEDGSA